MKIYRCNLYRLFRSKYKCPEFFQKQQHGGSKNPRQPACLITRDTNTIRHTQVRKTCEMVATFIILSSFLLLVHKNLLKFTGARGLFLQRKTKLVKRFWSRHVLSNSYNFSRCYFKIAVCRYAQATSYVIILRYKLRDYSKKLCPLGVVTRRHLHSCSALHSGNFVLVNFVLCLIKRLRLCWFYCFMYLPAGCS